MDNAEFLKGMAQEGAKNVNVDAGFKGAAEGLSYAMAADKAQQMKLQLEEARMKDNQMKTSITLDYLKTLSNANPKVRGLLSKQFGDFYKQAYGSELNQDTLKYIMDSPDSAQVVQALADAGVVQGFGQQYLGAVGRMAQALGSPILDAQAEFKNAFEMMSTQAKAEKALEMQKARLDVSSRNINTDNAVQVAKFEQDAEKDLESKKEKLGFISNAYRLAQQKERLGKMSVEELRVFDDNLVTAYTKMQDPTSVVMPSEVLRTLATMPFFDRLQTTAQKEFKTGGLLPKEQRKQMLKYLDLFQKEQTERFNSYVGSVSNRVSKIGGDSSTFSNYKFDPAKFKSQAQSVGVGAEDNKILTAKQKRIKEFKSKGATLDSINSSLEAQGLNTISKEEFDSL